MTIPLIQQPGPFQQLQAAVESIMAQRQQRQAQALQQMVGQAQLGQAQAQTAASTGQESRAQSMFEKTQQQNQEVADAVSLVQDAQPNTPEYDQRMAAALATLKTPQQTIQFRDALSARAETRLQSRRQQLYGEMLQKPTLENLMRAYAVALRENDEPYARMLSTMISSHGYEQGQAPMSAWQQVQVPLVQARTEAVKAQGELAGARKGWGPSRAGGGAGGRVSTEDRLATQLRSHYQRLLASRNPRTGVPRYRSPELAMQAAIELMGVNATPAVIARVRADPSGTATPAPATGTTANPYR